MGLLFTLIFFLHQIGCDKMEDGIVTEQERYFCLLRKNRLENEKNGRVFESSKSRYLD